MKPAPTLTPLLAQVQGLQHLADAAIATDLQGSIVFWNHAATRRLGWPAAEVLGQPLTTVLPTDYVAQAAMALHTQGHWQGERWQRDKAGTALYLQSSVAVIEDDQGQRLGYLSIHRDLTADKQAAQTQHANVARLERLNQILTGVLEHTHMMAVFLDPQFNFVWVNRAYAATGGQTPAFFVGQNHFALYPHAENQAIFQRVVDTGEPFFVAAKPFVFPDQPERGVTYWDWSLIPVRDAQGAITGLVFTLAEVTARQQAEDALRASEARFRQVWEATSDAMALSDAEGIVLDANSAYFRLYGYPPAQVLGQSFAVIFPEAAREQAVTQYQAVFASQKSAAPFEAVVRRADGTARIVDTRATFITLGGQRPVMLSTIRDITARKQAEEQISALAKFPAENPYPVLRVAADGTLLYINEAGAKQLAQWALQVGQPILPRLREAVFQVLATATMQTYDLVYGERLFAFHIVAVQGAGYANVYGYDITESRQMQALRATEARYRLLFEHSPYGVVLLDPATGKTLEANTQASQQLGYTAAEFARLRISDYEAVEEPEVTAQHIQNIILAGQDDFETQHRTKTGERREVHVWVKALVLEAQTFFYCIYQDITERKRLAATLQQRVRELELLYESGLAFSQLHTPPEIAQHIIRLLEQKMGWLYTAIYLYHPARDTLELLAVNYPQSLAPNARQGLEEKFKQAVAQPHQSLCRWVVQQGVGVSVPAVKTDARYVEVVATVQSGLYVPVKIGDRVIGVLSIESDRAAAFSPSDEQLARTLAAQVAGMLENARLYAESLQHAAELDARVAHRTTELEATRQRLEVTNAELRRALRVKDEFLANMSHELRTPLHAILGLSESLAEQIGGTLNPKQLQYTRLIHESGQHLLTLINDVLDLSKIGAGQLTLELAVTPLAPLCQACVRLVQELAQKKQISLTLELSTPELTAPVDALRLKQALVNLLGNAVKFTPPGGRVGLVVQAEAAAQQLAFTVWDTGIGIAPEDGARLFQPFSQLDSRLARGYAGTGLGLALVAQIARLHGGSVSVASQPQQGSRFTLTLPGASSAWPAAGPRPAPAPATSAPHAPGPCRILLVEDTEAVVVLTQDYLATLGYQVLVARTGRAGLAQAQAERPDLILLDVQMPDWNGLETARRMRDDPALQQTPIIALTALATPSDHERCLAAGMTDYLDKPVALHPLAQIVYRYLREAPHA